MNYFLAIFRPNVSRVNATHYMQPAEILLYIVQRTLGMKINGKRLGEAHY